jgi:hypothetical protein
MEGTDLQKPEALKAIEKIVKFNAFLQMISNKRSKIQYKLGAAAIRTYFDGNYWDFSINLYAFRDKSDIISPIIHIYLQYGYTEIFTSSRSFYHIYISAVWVRGTIDSVNKS